VKKVIVLGGCGAVGSVAVRTLVGQNAFGGVTIADANLVRGRELAEELGERGVTFVPLDAGDSASLERAIDGHDVVLNCVGPFYKTVRTVLDAVIRAGVDYVDICDDVDVTLEILELDARAREAGVTAVIGMGASPGATNLLAKFAYDALLDETESIDIFHTHGGEPIEGPGVIGHRFHCMSIDIPMYLDGELRTVRYFEDDGLALRQTFDFPRIGKDIPIFPYPHPEQVTLPRYLNVRRVTNKGSVLPIEYYRLTGELCRLGLADKRPVDVGGVEVVPYDFAVAWLLRERERILRETGFGGQRGCISVVVAGTKAGEPVEYRIHMASRSRALGEGTGIPAALGVLLLERGKISKKGVTPPEGCIDPTDFIELSRSVLDAEDSSAGAEKTIQVERISADGEVETLDI
jgi:saccharopine dehydrogenase (NAD+, L-lysine-forming)